jgi:hypothetical protein
MKRFFTFAWLCLFVLTTVAGPKEAKWALDNEDFITAYKEYFALAEKGDSDAMITLGLMYDQGDGRKQDYAKAMDWYLKAFAKQNGDAFNNIGVMYRDGLGVTQNREIAYALFWMSYWKGLGSEAAQIRNGRNLEKTALLMTKPQIETTLKMTSDYIVAFVENRGKLTSEQEQLKFAATGHPIKELAESGAADHHRGKHNLQVELRILKTVPFDDQRKLEFVTNEGINGSPLKSLSPREEQNHIIFSTSFLSFGESRHAVMVRPFSTAPTQVFPLPLTVKAADWSSWTKPEYLENSDASWTFMQNLKNAERFTDLPPNCFELRYKVEAAKKE